MRQGVVECLVRARAEGFELALELSKRTRELLAPRGMCGRLELPAELGIRKTERFRASHLLGIVSPLRHRAARPLFFPLVHAFLNPVLCVD